MGMERRTTLNWLRRGAALVGVLACLPLAGCGERLTVYNYERIEQGMTRDEVERILGRGEPSASAPITLASTGVNAGHEVRGRQAFFWRSAERQVTVMFRDGKVVSKYKDGF